MSAKVIGKCWKCGNNLTEFEFGRSDSCSNCNEDTHVCKNCVFYDPAYNNECRENQADRVVEKERSNFCDYFKANANSTGSSNEKDALKKAAEALFKK